MQTYRVTQSKISFTEEFEQVFQILKEKSVYYITNHK